MISTFFIVIETSSHKLWHAINKHGKIIIYDYEKIQEKGLGILFGQFLFFDCPLRWLVVGPPDHTFTLHGFYV
jgi:hypothetical protein